MLWIKAFHVIAVVSWFAGLLYLPRLFVYHTQCDDDADAAARARFETMERKLYWFIMTPAMLAALTFGMWMLTFGFRGTWLNIKLLLVLVLILFHASCYYYMRRLRHSVATAPCARFFRWYNEIPTALLIAIVVLVVVKPFA